MSADHRVVVRRGRSAEIEAAVSVWVTVNAARSFLPTGRVAHDEAGEAMIHLAKALRKEPATRDERDEAAPM